MSETNAAHIDWYKEMHSCVGDAAELADRISTSDSDVGGAIGRLCNVVTHLLDENKALAERVAALDKRADAHMNSISDMLWGMGDLREQVEAQAEVQDAQWSDQATERQDKRPEWVRAAMGEEHLEGCHTRWESQGECICDRIAAKHVPTSYTTTYKRQEGWP